MRHRNAGFSLIEVMCAILILGIALVGLTQGITAALKSSKESELQTTAAMIAAGQIETLRADGTVKDGEEEGECGEGLSLYKWKQSITSTSTAGLHEVTVVVQNSNSGTAIYELKTMLFDPPSESPTAKTGSQKSSKKPKTREGKNR
ncbi:MAG: Bacterial type secretion system protein [Pedosphaera sp.]|nr:Bacterial type secretion system protein [Pedosphaera sp.]